MQVAKLLSCVPSTVTRHDYVKALAVQFPPLLHSPARDRELVQGYVRSWLVLNQRYTSHGCHHHTPIPTPTGF